MSSINITRKTEEINVYSTAIRRGQLVCKESAVDGPLSTMMKDVWQYSRKGVGNMEFGKASLMGLKDGPGPTRNRYSKVG